MCELGLPVVIYHNFHSFIRLFPLFLKAQDVSKDIFVASVLLILKTDLVQ